MAPDKVPDEQALAHHESSWWMLQDICREYEHDHPVPWEIGKITVDEKGVATVSIVGPEIDHHGNETGHKEKHTYTAQVERVKES